MAAMVQPSLGLMGELAMAIAFAILLSASLAAAQQADDSSTKENEVFTAREGDNETSVPAESNLFAKKTPRPTPWPTYPPATPAPTYSNRPTYSIRDLEGYTFRGFGSCVNSKSEMYCCHIRYNAKTIEECATFCAETYAPHAEEKFIGIEYTTEGWDLPCTCLRDASSEYYGSDNGPIQGVDSYLFNRDTFCYSYDESLVSPVPSSTPSQSTHPTGSDRTDLPSTAPSLSLNPTSVVGGYVGKGACLDDFGNQYSTIKFHGPSPAFCAKHCIRIPTENEDDLVGFQHSTLYENECLCLFGSLTVNPSLTSELRKELGLRSMRAEAFAGKGQVATSTLHEGTRTETPRILLGMILPPAYYEVEDDTMLCFKWVPETSQEILDTKDSPDPNTCFNLTLSVLTPKVINYGLYFSWQIKPVDSDVGWGENSTMITPNMDSNTIVTKNAFASGVCLPINSTFSLRLKVHGWIPPSDIVLGSGISYVLSNAESQQVSCGIIDYISVSNPADKDAIETMNVIQFDKTSRGDCGIPFGQDSGYGFELLPSKCYYASFKLPKQGDFQLRIDREEWASCLIYNHCAANPSVCGCADVKQADYRGDIGTWSLFGNCSKWSEPRSYFDYETYEDFYYEDYSVLFPKAGLESNFCRNPDDSEEAWCWSTGQYKTACNIEYCPTTTESYLSEDCHKSDGMLANSLDEDVVEFCNYQQCVDNRGTESCECLFQEWDCKHGSKDCSLASCCRANLQHDLGTEIAQASCSCVIEPECDGGSNSYCGAFADYCCEDDVECRCKYNTQACQLALSNGADDAQQYCLKAEQTCCDAVNPTIGGCECDLWQSLCDSLPATLACTQAIGKCCGPDNPWCSCDFISYVERVSGGRSAEKQTICLNSNLVATSSVAKETKVLKEMYSSMNVTDRLVNEGGNHCDWQGVLCDDSSHVIGLSLEGLELSGAFPSELVADLHQLETLNLRNNRLTGSMDAITHVDHYEYAGKGRCQDSSGLEYTWLWSTFTGIDVTPERCDQFCRLASLERPKSHVGFHIKYPSVCHCLYDVNEGYEFISSELFKELNLPYIDENSLTLYTGLEGVGPVAKVLFDSAYHCYSSTPRVSYIDSSIFSSLRKLKHVDVSGNLLTGTVDALFAPSIEHFNASHNEFTRLSKYKVWSPSHGTLKTIDASYNQIRVVAMTLMSTLPINLNQFDFSHNSIVGSISSLRAIESLQSLDLSFNAITGRLPKFAEAFSNLRQLDLSTNELTGALHAEALNFQFMSLLLLSHNHLSSIDDTVSFSPQLQNLDVSYNSIKATIPKVLSTISELNMLKLNHNQLSGFIPTELGRLEDTSIYLEGNNLKKPAPLSLCFVDGFDLKEDSDFCPNERNSLRNLFYDAKGSEWTDSSNIVDPSDSLRSGSRSVQWLDEYETNCNWLGVSCDEMGMVTNITLRNNGLSGKLSSDIGLLKSLRVLDLSDNDIKGEIPPGLGALSNLTYLRLSFNEFVGVIPSEIQNLSNLTLLHLQGNRLIGNLHISSINNAYNESSFISDCGSPSLYGLPINCPDCSMCCNADSDCYPTSPVSLLEIDSFAFDTYESFSLLLVASTAALICLLASASYAINMHAHGQNIRSNRSTNASYRLRKEMKDDRLALNQIGEGSIYSFLLRKNVAGWAIALMTIGLQVWMLYPFIKASELDLSDDKSDVVYTWKCTRSAVELCEDLGDLTWQGWFIFVALLACFLSTDLINSIKLIWLSGKASRHTREKRFRFFLGGAFYCCITVYIMYVSVVYNKAIATSDTEIIYNVVIILFAMEVDEAVYSVLKALNGKWVERVANGDKNSVIEGIKEKDDHDDSLHTENESMKQRLLALERTNEALERTNLMILDALNKHGGFSLDDAITENLKASNAGGDVSHVYTEDIGDDEPQSQSSGVECLDDADVER